MSRKPIREASRTRRKAKGESQAEQGVRSGQDALRQIIAKADPESVKKRS